MCDSENDPKFEALVDQAKAVVKATEFLDDLVKERGGAIADVHDAVDEQGRGFPPA